jgi:hypothetical protein
MDNEIKLSLYREHLIPKDSINEIKVEPPKLINETVTSENEIKVESTPAPKISPTAKMRKEELNEIKQVEVNHVGEDEPYPTEVRYRKPLNFHLWKALYVEDAGPVTA